jgi:hypothetical protein
MPTTTIHCTKYQGYPGQQVPGTKKSGVNLKVSAETIKKTPKFPFFAWVKIPWVNGGLEK